MTEFIELLLLGLGAGALYALAALGLVLVYRSSGVLNFAHGAIGMAGSFVFYDLLTNGGWATVPAATAGVLASGALGFITYVVSVRLPRGGSTLTRVIATLAVLLILEAVASLRYGTDALIVPQFLPHGTVDFGGGISIDADRLILLAAAIVLTAILTIVYRRSRFGIATSAVSESPRNLAALGWPVERVRALNWILGGLLAGLSSVLLSPIAGVSVDNAVVLIVPVLAAALIGRLSSFPLTLGGGLFIGIVEAELSRHDFGIVGISDAVPFAVIIAVLVVRGHVLPLRSFVGERLPSLGDGRVHRVGALLGVAVVLVLIGVLSDDWVNALLTSLSIAIVVLSLTVVLGLAGQLSLCQITLAGCGALIASKLVASAGLSFVPAALIAVCATVPVGVLLGLPSVKTRGVSLAVATLGLAVAVGSLVFDNPNITGGTNGILVSTTGTLPIFGMDFDSLLHVRRYTILVLAVLVLLMLAVANLRRGRAGRRFVAVRGNERAAAALGVDVVATKLSAFGLGAGIAAVGGVLIAFRYESVLFDQFDAFNNISPVAYGVVGGIGRVLGGAAGSTLVDAGLGNQLLQTLVSGWAKYIDLIGGVLLLLVVVAFPDGAVAGVERLVRRVPTRGGARPARPIERVAPPSVVAKPLLVTDVRVRFGGVIAVDGVDLTVEPGTVVSVIGPNGAGKTTLIDAITGFVPAQGSVRLAGQELMGRSTHRRARAGLSRSFQSLELFEDLTVLENLRCAADPQDAAAVVVDLLRPARGAMLSPATAAAIGIFGLGPHLDERPGVLSAGTRRLVAMARAISGAPSILLLDEPCAGLDTDERLEVSRLIRSLAHDWGMGVLLVEHDVELVRRVSDRIVVLDFGRVIAAGTAKEVLDLPAVAKAYLGTLEPIAGSA